MAALVEIQLKNGNAGRCCVYKRKGIGLHLHHIDGDNSNTVDENIAVLCVEDHDHHHRPDKYTKANHLELSREKLLEYKRSWESFVENAQSQNPSVLAVINVFGSFEHVHAAKIIFQWPNQKIEFERTFHLLEGNFEYWTDEMISEVQSIGSNVKLTIIDDPLPVEYCPCCGIDYSNTVKEALVIKSTDPTWSSKVGYVDIHKSRKYWFSYVIRYASKTPLLCVIASVPKDLPAFRF